MLLTSTIMAWILNRAETKGPCVRTVGENMGLVGEGLWDNLGRWWTVWKNSRGVMGRLDGHWRDMGDSGESGGWDF